MVKVPEFIWMLLMAVRYSKIISLNNMNFSTKFSKKSYNIAFSYKINVYLSMSELAICML